MGESTSERGAGVWHGPPSALSLSVAAAEACEHPHVGAELRVVLELVGHGGRYRGLLELPLVLRRAQAAARGFGFGSGFGLDLRVSFRVSVRVRVWVTCADRRQRRAAAFIGSVLTAISISITVYSWPGKICRSK